MCRSQGKEKQNAAEICSNAGFCNSLSRHSTPFLLFQGDYVHKSVFIIFFQGDQLKNRVKKICEGYGCPTAGQLAHVFETSVWLRTSILQLQGL